MEKERILKKSSFRLVLVAAAIVVSMLCTVSVVNAASTLDKAEGVKTNLKGITVNKSISDYYNVTPLTNNTPVTGTLTEAIQDESGNLYYHFYSLNVPKKAYYLFDGLNYNMTSMELDVTDEELNARKVFDDENNSGTYNTYDALNFEKGKEAVGIGLLPKGTNYFLVSSRESGDYALMLTKAADYLSAPSSVTTKLYGYNDVKISWKAVSGASAYSVYYKKNSGKWVTLKKTVTGTSIKKANLADGAKYTFKVVPYVNSTVGMEAGEYLSYDGAGKSSSIYTLKKLSAPKVKKSSSKAVKVSWSNISGESGYQVATSKYKSKKFKVVKTVKANVKSAKISAKKNKTMYYKVRAYKTVDGKKIYGPWSSARKYKLK